MKVISWNLLRLTGAAVEDVAALIAREKPDLMLMQEATEPHGRRCRRWSAAISTGCPGWGASTASASGACTASRRRARCSLPASRLPGRLPRRRAQLVQLGDITFANVHLSHGQLLNRRQLARIAAALRGKPSAIIGDYNMVGPRPAAGLHRCRAARADALRQQRRAVPARPLPGARPHLSRRRRARLRPVRPPADPCSNSQSPKAGARTRRPAARPQRLRAASRGVRASRLALKRGS